MSSLSGPLQVVPDVDDQVVNPEHAHEVRYATPAQRGLVEGLRLGIIPTAIAALEETVWSVLF